MLRKETTGYGSQRSVRSKGSKDINQLPKSWQEELHINQKSIGASVSDKSQLVKEKHGHAAVS